MLALIHLSLDALTDRDSLATLSALALRHDLILVCRRHFPAHPVTVNLRAALPGRRIMAMLVDGEPVGDVRRLVEESLREGAIPLLLTRDEPSATRLVNSFWLTPDRVLVLPAAPTTR
jgi:hypothetical protein